MTDKKVRDRIVTIERIYEEPKITFEDEEKGYKAFSLGIKLEDGSYANITGFAQESEDFMEKAKKIMIVDQKTGEEIKAGNKYKIYEESKDGKYWRVVSFVKENGKIEEEYVSDSTSSPEEDAQNVREQGNGGSPSPVRFNEERKQMLIVRQTSINYATQLAAIFYAWKKRDETDKEDKTIDIEYMKNQIKSIAKEYEEMVKRS